MGLCRSAVAHHAEVHQPTFGKGGVKWGAGAVFHIVFDELGGTSSMNDYFEELSRIAAEMNRTRPSPDAEVGYDLLTDALVWSDEYPGERAGRLEDYMCLRLLFRYRTTLLLGNPDDFFKPYWDRAMELFPDWAGFCPTRLSCTEELRRFYECRKKRDMRLLDLWDAKCRQSAPSSTDSTAGGARETGGETGGQETGGSPGIGTRGDV